MEVHFTIEEEAQLKRHSARTGMNPENFVRIAALRLIQENERLSTAVRQRLPQSDRGELVDDDEVRLWLDERERSCFRAQSQV